MPPNFHLKIALSVTTSFMVVTLGLTAYTLISRTLLYNAAQNAVPPYADKLK